MHDINYAHNVESIRRPVRKPFDRHELDIVNSKPLECAAAL